MEETNLLLDSGTSSARTAPHSLMASKAWIWKLLGHCYRGLYSCKGVIFGPLVNIWTWAHIQIFGVWYK